MKKISTMVGLGLMVSLLSTMSFCHADILSAIRSGNIDEVRNLVTKNPGLSNAKILKDATALQVAVDSRHPEIAKWLVENGANYKIPFADGSPPLIHAAMLDEESLVELFVGLGTPVDVLWGNGIPLELAAQFGSLRAAKALIALGADVNNPTINPMTAAILQNQLDFARFLLANGAQCSYRGINGETYLHYLPVSEASDGGRAGGEFVDLLLSCGIDVNTRDYTGNTPLNTPMALHGSNLSLVQHLIAKGADINAVNNMGETPLLRAASSGHLSPLVLRYVLDQEVDVNAFDHEGLSLLHYIARHTIAEGKEMAASIIARGADVNAKVRSETGRGLKEEYTPLHFAAESGQIDIAAVLIDQNADVNALAQGQHTPLNLSISTGNIAIVRLLLDHGAIFKSKSGEDEESPLIHAVRAGNLEIAKLLIERGADVNASDRSGMSPLHWAAKYGFEEFAQLLMTHGADVNAKDDRELSPIHLATEPISGLLLAKGALDTSKALKVLAKQACNLVITNANKGTLETINKQPYSWEKRSPIPRDILSDDDLTSIDQLNEIEVQGAYFLLGMAGAHPIFLSYIGGSRNGELACRIGRSKETTNYFVRTHAEVAVDQYIRKESTQEIGVQSAPEAIPTAIFKGAEIHVVSGYDVEARDPSRSESNVVNVTIDRPGKKVVLILNSVNSIDWHVKASATTKIAGILFASAKGNRSSESDSNVIAIAPVYRVSIPIVLFELNTRDFGSLLGQIKMWSGGRRKIDFFFGERDLPASININQVVTNDKRLSFDFPLVQPTSSKMTFNLFDRTLTPRQWTLTGPVAKQSKDFTYLDKGKFAVAPYGNEAYFLNSGKFILVNLKTGESNNFALPSHFPPFSGVIGLAYDTRRDIVSVASYGGEGFFYRFDVKTRRWLDYHSFQDVDLLALAYDKVLDRYLGWTSNGGLIFVGADGEIGIARLCASLLPGFGRIVPQNDELQHLIEIKPSGNDLALIASLAGKVRGIWHFDLDSGKAELTFKAQDSDK